MFIFIWSTCPSFSLSSYLRLHIYLSTSLPVYLSIYSPVYVSTCLPVYFYAFLTAYHYISPSVYQCICLMITWYLFNCIIIIPLITIKYKVCFSFSFIIWWSYWNQLLIQIDLLLNKLFYWFYLVALNLKTILS